MPVNTGIKLFDTLIHIEVAPYSHPVVFKAGAWHGKAYPPRLGYDTYCVRLRFGDHVLSGVGATLSEAADVVEKSAGKLLKALLALMHP